MELAFADHHLMGLWDWQKVVSLAEAYGVPGTIWVEQFRRLEQYLDP